MIIRIFSVYFKSLSTFIIISRLSFFCGTTETIGFLFLSSSLWAFFCPSIRYLLLLGAFQCLYRAPFLSPAVIFPRVFSTLIHFKGQGHPGSRISPSREGEGRRAVLSSSMCIYRIYIYIHA